MLHFAQATVSLYKKLSYRRETVQNGRRNVIYILLLVCYWKYSSVLYHFRVRIRDHSRSL